MEEHRGLGYFNGTVEKIDLQDDMGAPLQVPSLDGILCMVFRGFLGGHAVSSVAANNAYYFVHSFSARPENEKEICAVAHVGNGEVVAAIRRDNILGVQFHPERSSEGGWIFERFSGAINRPDE